MSTTETYRPTNLDPTPTRSASAGTQTPRPTRKTPEPTPEASDEALLPHPTKVIANSGPSPSGGDPATQTANDYASTSLLTLSGPTLSHPTTPTADAKGLPSGGDSNSVTDQSGCDAHRVAVGHGPSSTASQQRTDPQGGFAGRGSTSALDQSSGDIQWTHVEGGFNSQQAKESTEPVDSSPAGADAEPDRTASAPMEPNFQSLFDPALAFAADILDDMEGLWVANSNRLRTLTTAADQEDADGVCRGFGLTEAHPDVARLAAMVATLEQLTKDATKHLEKVMRRHPLHPWVKAQKGLGDKQTARLLAAIGDPYWNTLHDRPRTVSELWAYCGFHVLPAGQKGTEAQSNCAGRVQAGEGGGLRQELAGTQDDCAGVAPRRQRGRKANWSETARKRAWLIANSVVKAGGPYREVYDATKDKYADAIHSTACVRCGPAGKPAQPGSPLSKAHIHARGLRAISKAVLKDLWIEAKRLHELPVSGQSPTDAQRGGAAGGGQT